MPLKITDLHVRSLMCADQQKWRDWADGACKNTPPEDDEKAPACAVAPMLRRRLTPLGRLALGALAEIKPRDGEEIIFASSWGDINRSYELLRGMTQGEGVSPMGFASSVHNAIGAVASIWLKNKSPYRAITAGDGTAAAAFNEARCLLTFSKAKSVIIVRYEDVMPQRWKETMRRHSDNAFAFAWAARLELSETEGITVSKSPATGNHDADCLAKETAFIAGTGKKLEFFGANETWIWERK